MKRFIAPQKKRTFALACITCISPTVVTSCSSGKDDYKDQHPNIIIILADDMGYGDVNALNPYGRIQTPALDRMVHEGITFTDAHASGSVCTPSRYGILTGRYAMRTTTGADSGIHGFDKSVIEVGRETIASHLKKAGYISACIGKWHLGLDWQTKDGSKAALDPNTGYSNVDYSKNPTRGPNDYGFDYSFIHPASLDIPPYVFLRNHQVVDPDVILTTDVYPRRKEYTEYAWDRRHTDEHAVYWEKGVWWRQGEMSRSYRIEDCQTTIVSEGLKFIDNHTANNPDKPFFMHLQLTGPHTPWVPIEKFKGKSPIGLYGDFCMEVDYIVQQIKEKLVEQNIDQNTILVFTSDNGAYWPQEEVDLHNHDSNWGRRGQKADVWDGGHRVPLLITWPAKIQEPMEYHHFVSLTDFFATFSDIAGLEMNDTMGEDSFSFKHVIDGDTETNVRPTMTHYTRRMSGIRNEEWKFIDGLGSGGFTAPNLIQPQPGGPTGQLYRIKSDSLESENLYMNYPERVSEMRTILEQSKTIPDRLRLQE
jgi:arylsulfatase A